MASISAAGIGCAAPTTGWAGSTPRRAALIGLAALSLPGAGTPRASLEVTVAGLRSGKGLVQACLTAVPAHFPDCAKDPAARRLSVPAASGQPLRFDDLASGNYAIALFHDENGNGRLDTRFGIPVEGFGFSNNPRIYFGPPSFAAARFSVGGAPVAETVRIRYFFRSAPS